MKLLHEDLWPTITRLARKSGRKHVAVAYLGSGASRLLPLGRGDSLVVDMSPGAVKSGQTNPFEVENTSKRGSKSSRTQTYMPRCTFLIKFS